MKKPQHKTKPKELSNPVKRVKNSEQKFNVDEFLETKREVRNILGISEAEHNEMLYKDGLRWLDEVPDDRRELVYLFQDNPRWWNWFKNEYYIIDRRFVKEMIIGEKYQRSRKEALSHYKRLHEHGYRLIWDNRTFDSSGKVETVKQLKKRNHG